MVGRVVGSYRLVDVLGDGGMGTVYRAEHVLLGRPAAVKLLHAELARDRELVGRFFNEARAATSIHHPGIVEVFDFGYAADGSAFLVMELLRGESLARRLRARGRLPEPEAVAVVRGIASALGAAHARGIVHRDIKPDNIFLVPDPEAATGERVKVLDFGIAMLAALAGDLVRTRTGTLLGTPTYMAPEQCGGTVDVEPRSDLYALGCVLFELLVGRPPFTHAAIVDVLAAHRLDPPPPLRTLAPEVSPHTARLVAALLAKAPADRPASAYELVRLLGRGGTSTTLGQATVVLPASPATARPRDRRVIAATAAGLVAAAVGATLLVERRAPPPGPAPAVRPTVEPTPRVATPGAVPPAVVPAGFVVLRVAGPPSGTEVYGPRGLLGVAPGPVQLERSDQPIVLTFKADDHLARSYTVVPRADGVLDVELVRRRRRPPPRARPDAAPAAATGSAAIEDPFDRRD